MVAFRRFFASSFLAGVVGACSSQVSIGSSGASSSSGGHASASSSATSGTGGAIASSGTGGAATCPAPLDACQACVTSIQACSTLEACLADPMCAQQWEPFKTCESAGKDFTTCVGLLGGDLELRVANDCSGPCAGVNATCKAKTSPGACAQCCAMVHPSGFSTYKLAASGCACAACSATCAAATCQTNQPPSDACVPCVQTSLFHDCDTDQAFQAQCGGATGSDCADLVDCILNCG